ncbi:hypothetical protein QYM36_017086 [Artemia franciscana]|uniref:Uncharacterized protein n=1 Tax=Artemia franciscana TaxID=6661 RepID=A0AA88HD95_ARTSF|nr:hypothetical protein QYM36_017086 [Artemia franciscana]
MWTLQSTFLITYLYPVLLIQLYSQAYVSAKSGSGVRNPTGRRSIETYIVPRWKENPLLAQLRHASKFWHKMWMDIGKPWSGAVNMVQIYLKRKFVKCLQKHNATILDENCNVLESNPNAMWNFCKRKKRSDCNGPSLWPTEEQWNSYYKIEFVAPDAQL